VRIVRLSLSGPSVTSGPLSSIATVSYDHDPTLSRCHHHRFSKICGDFVIIEGGNHPNSVILLKLWSLSYRTFELPSVRILYDRLALTYFFFTSQARSQVELIAGHIIISELDDSTYTVVKIRVWNADLFLKTPVKCIGGCNNLNYCDLDDSTALISESMDAGGSKCYSHHLSAHASPLQEDLYIIWLSTDAFIKGRHTIIIRKYYLSTLEPTWHHKASQPRFPDSSKFWWDRVDASVSYAGHMTVYRHVWEDLQDMGYDHGLIPLGDRIPCNSVSSPNTCVPRQKRRLEMFRKVRIT
jgi:hypothetical protein